MTKFKSSRYVRVGVLRDVTRLLKSDWFALYAMYCRPSLPVRRRGSARLQPARNNYAYVHVLRVGHAQDVTLKNARGGWVGWGWLMILNDACVTITEQVSETLHAGIHCV